MKKLPNFQHKTKTLCLLMVSLLGLAGLYGQDWKTETSPSKTFLWRLSSASATVYLAGTVHVGKEEMYPLPDAFLKAYQASDSLLMEVNQEELLRLPTAVLKFMDRMYMPEFKGALELYSDHVLEKLRVITASQDLSMFDAVQPWVVSLFLSMKAVSNQSYTVERGVDAWLLSQAQEDNKSVRSLETAEFQIQLMIDLFPRDVQEQVVAFEELIGKWDQTAGLLDNLLTAYRNGDVVGLESAFVAEFKQDQAAVSSAYQSVVVDRNHNMATVVKQILKENGVYFFAVGAGHLVGDQSVVDILRKEGFKLTRL